MSTKIYYGYKLKDIKTFDELELLRIKLVTDAKAAQQQIATTLIFHTSLYMLDLYKVGFDVPDINQGILNYGYHKVSERLRKFKTESYKDPIYDLRFEVVFFLQDPILAIFIGDNKNMQSIFANNKSVEYYGYWNNVDPPEDVTDDEWDQRKKDWDFLEGPVCNNGFILSVDEYPHFDLKEETFSNYILPKWETRCHDVARSIILHKIDQKTIDVPHLQDGRNAIQLANDIFEWIKSDEGQKLLNDEKEVVKNILNQTVMYNDLFNTCFKDVKQENRLL